MCSKLSFSSSAALLGFTLQNQFVNLEVAMVVLLNKKIPCQKTSAQPKSMGLSGKIVPLLCERSSFKPRSRRLNNLKDALSSQGRPLGVSLYNYLKKKLLIKYYCIGGKMVV